MILNHNNSEVLKNEYQELFFFFPQDFVKYGQLFPANSSYYQFLCGKKKNIYIYIYMYIYVYISGHIHVC